MADEGRVVSLLVELSADESTETGRVASLFVEVPGTESTETGRVASLFVEVPGTESTETGRVAAHFAEVIAKASQKVRVAGVYAEVFITPRQLESPNEGNDPHLLTGGFGRGLARRRIR